MTESIPTALRRAIIDRPEARAGYDALVVELQQRNRDAAIRAAARACIISPGVRSLRGNLLLLLSAAQRWDELDAAIPGKRLSPEPRRRLEVDIEGAVALYEPLLEQMRLRTWEGWTPSRVETSKNRFPLTREHLANFRRSEVSSGTQTFPDTPKGFPRLDFSRLYPDYTEPEREEAVAALRGQYLSFYTRLYRRGSSGTDWYEASVPDDDRFGARTVEIPGVGTTTSKSILAAYYACRIMALVPRNGVVLEIGGGFGAVASKLLAIRPDITYVLTDLPVNMVLTHTYLRSFFGDGVAGVWNDGDRPSAAQKVVVVPPWRLSDLGMRVDLAVNTMSFQHMDERNHVYYGNALRTLGTRQIYHVNRNAFIPSAHIETMVVPATQYSFMTDYEVVETSDFDARWIEVIAKAKA